MPAVKDRGLFLERRQFMAYESNWYPELVGKLQPEAWRICAIDSDGVVTGLPYGFQRERDAMMALEALARAGVNSAEEIRSRGRRWIEKTMMEALQW